MGSICTRLTIGVDWTVLGDRVKCFSIEALEVVGRGEFAMLVLMIPNRELCKEAALELGMLSSICGGTAVMLDLFVYIWDIRTCCSRGS